MAAEKRLKQEIDDLWQHIKKMQEAERKERRKLAEEDALRKIKKMEETIIDLNKSLATQKQVSEYLLLSETRTVQFLYNTPCYDTDLVKTWSYKNPSWVWG